MSATEKPVCASSVIVSVPAVTAISPAHAPTGTLRDRVSNLKLKEPVTPLPSASLQICRRPVGMGVGVAVQLSPQPGGVFVGRGVDVWMEVGVRVGVGEPATLFVKIASMTPLTILTVTTPCGVSLLTVRSGLTSIRET